MSRAEMAKPESELQDRFRAAVLGFAIGDALGFPLKGIPSASLARATALAEDFAPRPRGRFAKGQFSDDTQMMLAVAESLALEGRVDGRSAAAHVAWLWEEGVILAPPLTLGESAERLLRGTPWMSAGAPIGVQDPSALSRGLVLGLFCASRPERVPHDAAILTVITHKDRTCAAATAAYARAVSLMLTGEPLPARPFCEAIAAAAAVDDPALAAELQHLPRVLSWEPVRALPQLRRIGVRPGALEETDGLPAHVTPVLLTALYAALTIRDDFRAAVALVLSVGGEADIAAGLCGGLLGAVGGYDALPPRLRKNVLYADHLLATADRLFDAAIAREHAVAPAPARARLGRR